MSTVTQWEGPSPQVPIINRRRESRLPVSFPAVVCGLEETGHFFVERTATLNISEFGCCFQLRRMLPEGTVVAIRLMDRNNEQLDNGRPLLFQIEWLRTEADSWLAGASSFERRSLWRRAFQKVR